jgi:hypothetical protein
MRTKNVAALTIDLPPGTFPKTSLITKAPTLKLEEGELSLPRIGSDLSWTVHLHKGDDGRWEVGPMPDKGLRKRHGLQGPIDDAFLDSFLVVRPTGTPKYERVAAWAKSEQNRAIEHWRRHFRGDARVKDDKDINDADIAGANLVLWGDPGNNAVLAKIADKLPIAWKDGKITAGDRAFSAENHALILIYPNPLNPSRYVVLNSGFTFRDYDYLNNARQTPKLPDWAIVDVRTPPNSRWPGKVVDADFFGEAWDLKPAHKE